MTGRRPKVENSYFSSRLTELILEKKLILKELGAIFGVSEGAVSSWRTGRRMPEQETLQSIANYFNVSTDYLLGNSNLRDKTENLRLENNEMVYLPIIGMVKIGNTGLVFQDNLGKDCVEKSEVDGGNHFWLKVKGDSMIGDGILENDLVLVREQSSVETGCIAIVIVGDEEGNVKRIEIKENSIVLKSSNNKYEPQIFIGEDMKQVRIVGKVNLIKRRLK